MVNPQRLGQNDAQTPDWNDVEDSLGAGWRGATDAATLGLADNATAAIDATAAMARGRNWFDRYKSDRTQQTAQNQYDAQHHALAQHLGQAIGTVVGIAATDGLTAAPAASARIAFSTPTLGADLVRLVRPWGAAAGVGAGVDVAGQGLSDAAKGQLSSPQTYLSDAAGGAVGGMATLARSPAAGAAADAVVNGLTHSALTGEPVPVGDMEKNALAGAYVGLLGHAAGSQWADNLDWRDKGDLGEYMAKRTSDILGDGIRPDLNPRYKVSGGTTVADHVTDRGPVEAKFGDSARLSKRQREASKELPVYDIYHFLPEDVGRITGGLLALANAQNGNGSQK